MKILLFVFLFSNIILKSINFLDNIKKLNLRPQKNNTQKNVKEKYFSINFTSLGPSIKL